ncbi:hypothetical protein GCM10010182_37820 [Actinomadura cremea]|nr:hypothetical protein GCM10010182_37820 [Actinomadura cremea]
MAGAGTDGGRGVRGLMALARVDAWFTRNGAKAVGWTVGGIGIGVALNAAVALLLAPA